MFTIAAPTGASVSLDLERQYAAAWRATQKWPFMWTSTTTSHSASSMLKLILSRRIPALLMTMSSPPKISTALPDHRLGVGPRRHRSGVGDRRATGGDDLVDDLLGGPGIGARSVGGAAEIVDDDGGALTGEQQRLGAADASTRARDDGDLPVEPTHVCLLPSRATTETDTNVRCVT